MKRIFSIIAASAAIFASCEKPSVETPVPAPQEPEKLPISITRATTGSSDFVNGDKVGLYVVNYTSNGAGSLVANGNHVDNMCFTYQGVWSPAKPIYWADATTRADFYCYSPYTANVSSVSEYSFAVGTNQSTADAYKASDFLWGKVSGAQPSAEPVGITLDHKMSRLSVTVVAGNGYSAEDVKVANVTIGSVKTEAKINLATGAVTAHGNTGDVIPNYSDGEYSAYLVPQTLNDADLVKIVIGDRTYVLKQSITLEGGMQHKCTITVTKTDQGINIGVSGWVVDSYDYGGVLE